MDSFVDLVIAIADRYPGIHYRRNGRPVTARPWHKRLCQLSRSLEERLFLMPYRGCDRLYMHARQMMFRAWALSPAHFAYMESHAGRSWQRYLAADHAARRYQ
jgi:hypothetical protein